MRASGELTESYLGGGRIRQSSGEYSPELRGSQLTCDICRARMCTEGVLSKLRCAECRQIKSDQFREVAAKSSLIALGSFFLWYLLFRSTEHKGQAGEAVAIDAAGLPPQLIANRRRA